MEIDTDYGLQAPTVPAEEESNTRGCGKAGLVFALLLFAAAYFFVCLVPLTRAPLGYLVLTALLYAATIVFAYIKGGKLSVHSVLALLFGLTMPLYRFLDGVVIVDYFPPVFLLSIPCYAYFTVSLFNNHSRSFGGGFLLDIIKGFAYAFISFVAFFRDLFTFGGEKRGGKKFGILLLGILVAVVFLFIVGSLLSYDANFADMMPDINIDTIFETVFKLSFAVPIAAMTYSCFASSYQHKLPLLSAPETVERVGKSVKVIPSLVVIIPAAALLVMYVMFFISQWAYYMSAFTHTLPEGYSFAEYAREGFFQLCAVACINGLLVAVLRCFTKIKGKADETACYVLTVLLALSTLVLIATALSKMLLYIGEYDLTRLRLIVTLVLVFLAIAFIAVIVSVIAKRVKAMPAVIISAAALLMLFALCFPNSLIARYNVNAYLSGRHQNIDVSYLETDIGFSAVPELIRLYENAPDGSIRAEANEALDHMAKEPEKNDVYFLFDLDENYNKHWYNLSLPRIRANKLLADRMGE